MFKNRRKEKKNQAKFYLKKKKLNQLFAKLN